MNKCGEAFLISSAKSHPEDSKHTSQFRILRRHGLKMQPEKPGDPDQQCSYKKCGEGDPDFRFPAHGRVPPDER